MKKFNSFSKILMVGIFLPSAFLAIQTQISFAQGGIDETDPPPVKHQVNYVSVSGFPLKSATDPALLACVEAAMSARTACLASLSPKLQGAAALIGGILGTVSMTQSSTSQTCEKYNKAMRIAETALVAYNSICTAMQTSCESTCEAAMAKLGTDKTELAARLAYLQKLTGLDVTQATKLEISQISSIDLPANSTAQGKTTKDLATCQKYKWNLAAAGVGLMNVVKQSAASSTCKDATTVADCTKDPTNPACQKNIDCSKQENYQQTYCVCQRRPNTPGCVGYAGTQIDISAPNYNGVTRGTNENPVMPALNSDDSIAVQPGAAGAGGSGMASQSGGSLSGLGGDGSGSPGLGAAAKNGGADGKKEKGLNTNILGGFDGGGGGGSGGSYAGSRSTASQDSQYRNYIPGATKDPTVKSGTSSYSNEITSGGAKTNWQKVREMYLEKQTTLVGN